MTGKRRSRAGGAKRRPAEQKTIEGVLEVKQGGFGFVRMPEGEKDIFVGAMERGGARNGELVRVRLKRRRKGSSPEGEVVEVLSGMPTLVGTMVREKRAAHVVADGRQAEEVFIPKGQAMHAQTGQKVVVEVTRRAVGASGAEGKVTEVLGYAGKAGVDILSVARAFGLTAAFPAACEAQAGALRKEQISAEGRADFRGDMIVTIDGADAKDLDDAVSLRKLPNGNRLLGVHIADVSHYVRESSALDAEALARGTSVYLIDQVIPMLPAALSNDLCSLNPGEEKYALSCLMELDGAGDVVKSEIARSVITSKYRMTYADVNRILEGDKKLRGSYGQIAPLLDEMNMLAKELRQRRYDLGSIDFDLDEAQITLDKKGAPTSVTVRERGDAEKLIEEFMLRANVTVAETFYKMDAPFIYRIHEQPDAEKMKELAIFLSNFGVKLEGAGDVEPRAIQNVLGKVAGRPEEGVVNSVTLRSLKKARYAAQPGQHFGLAARQYCHFTSPIRRYPDLMAHRIIHAWLAGGLDKRLAAHFAEILPEVAAKSSARERNAIEAERAVNDMKMAEYMSGRIGEEYDGVVSGVTRFGIFVELENTVEGMVPMTKLDDDYYVYHEKLYCLIGERTKRRITLGDKARVRVVAADAGAGKIEFELA